MQYVRSIGGSVSKTWNSINPATLSGAIDVVVVEQADGSLACSPFHVRFGKFSLLRPSEKKVEFKVNNVKQDYAMKLGEGGEAFFVFETYADIPEGLQTSPVISPMASPASLSQEKIAEENNLQEPEPLDLGGDGPRRRERPRSAFLEAQPIPILGTNTRAHDDLGRITPVSGSPSEHDANPISDWSPSASPPKPAFERSNSDELLSNPAVPEKNEIHSKASRSAENVVNTVSGQDNPSLATARLRSSSPPLLTTQEAVNRAIAVSKKLSNSNIRSKVTDSGDLMLDMEGFKSSEEEALRAELIARKVLAEELQGNYDIGALIGADERGNLWIYSSEEAKEAAARKNLTLPQTEDIIDDAASDPGHQSDDERSITGVGESSSVQRQHSSHRPAVGLVTPPKTPPDAPDIAEPATRSYAKTLRLTSAQLKALNLKPGANAMSFSVNRATCQAYMYYWSYDVPVVISDIDGTITKSDALGHVLNMIGRDWTHTGVAKLYTDIVANGYNILYLTSRSVGQADTTRTYLDGINQDGHKLPKGPVILSPDRTIAALRREVYLRKPEVFKMACLRDIGTLFGKDRNPFYAGFGNRLTDALSYRSVKIPQNRIFTINPNAEVSIDILSLNKYKSSYVSMRELVDHFFPPVGLLIKSGGEDFTDFSYWRSAPLDIEDFSGSESEDDDHSPPYRRLAKGSRRRTSEDEGSDGDDEEEEEEEAEEDEQGDALTDSYVSRDSVDQGGELVDSILESIEDEELVKRRASLDSEHAHEPDDEPTPLSGEIGGDELRHAPRRAATVM